jgi:hypothetical protein
LARFTLTHLIKFFQVKVNFMASNGLVKEQHGNKDNFPTSLAMLLIFILLFFQQKE